MIKTLFIGSNWEALHTLRTLVNDERFDVVGLITQPDKPVGRKQEIKESGIKKYAKSKDIPVFHTNKSEEKYHEALRLFNPELIVCKSFGEILPGFFIDHPKYKTINVHYSLLPKYRGAVPIQKAILEGDEITGITIVQMVEKLDAGPILKNFEVKIDPKDSNQSLREKLVEITGENLGDVLHSWVNGDITPVQQDNSKATYCWQNDISKENAFINWEKHSPTQIDRKVRAFLPWPVAWSYLNNKRLKIFDIEIIPGGKHLKPGEYAYLDQRLIVGSINPSTSIAIKDAQLEGGKRMSGGELGRGLHLG